MALDFILPSALRGTTGGAQSGTISVPMDQHLRAELVVTASAAPTSLNAQVQHSSDGGNTWVNLKAFTQVGAVSTSSESIEIQAPTSGMIRVNYASVGTSYTFQVTIRHQDR